ncbi:hypothetical protein TWF281_005031 [Arthrobotrys megalospora]
MSNTYRSAYQSGEGSGSNAVRVGFWYDYDRGTFLGPTLTLQDRHATILLVALTVFITLAAGRSWHIWRSLAHALLGRRNGPEPDKRTREQQVILRNSDTPAGALLGLAGGWFTSGYTQIFPRRSASDYILPTFALGHVCVFIAAGLLVSQVVVGKVVVSKITPTCGQWYPRDQESNSTEDARQHRRIEQEFHVNRTMDAENYVRSCYDRSGSQAVIDCDKFITRSIPFRTESNTRCPFRNGTCWKGENLAFTMDTGNITLSQLGINNKYGKHISFRRLTQCTVVNANLFRLPPDGSGNWTDYSFAQINGENVTTSYANDEYFAGWTLYAYTLPGEGSIHLPLRPEYPTANDVSVLLMQGGLLFMETSDDPWFSVHGTNPTEYYLMDNFVNMVACTEQKQWCSSITGQCLPLTGLLVPAIARDLEGSFQTLLGQSYEGSKNSKDGEQFLWSVFFVDVVAKESSLSSTIQYRHADALLQAASYTLGGRQSWLHPEQWKVELSRWFAMALAKIQLETIDSIEAPKNFNLEQLKNAWAEGTEDGSLGLRVLCGRVKFRDPNHTSMSTLGIAGILAVAGALVLASFAVLVWQQVGPKDARAIADWRRDEVLSLLDATEDIPVVPSTILTDSKQDKNLYYVE